MKNAENLSKEAIALNFDVGDVVTLEFQGTPVDVIQIKIIRGAASNSVGLKIFIIFGGANTHSKVINALPNDFVSSIELDNYNRCIETLKLD